MTDEGGFIGNDIDFTAPFHSSTGLGLIKDYCTFAYQVIIIMIKKYLKLFDQY